MKNKSTRGSGLLELFLANKRAKLANKLIKQEHRRGKILDIGCGKFPLFLSRIEFKEKHGIDFQIPVKTKQFKLKQLDLTKSKLPYRSNSFNTITMLAVLEHLSPENIPRLLKEVFRTLKPNSNLIITTPSPLGNKVLKIMAKLNLVSKEEINEHKKIYSLKDLKSLLQSQGFKLTKVGNFELFMNNFVCAEKPLREF